jgi:hypothetical protein
MDVTLVLIGVCKILLSITMLVLIFSPIIFIGVSMVMILCGKYNVLNTWLRKHCSGKNNLAARSFNNYCYPNEPITDESKPSALDCHVWSDSEWLSDIHTNPLYSSFPCNSSYETIGPGSWDNDI